MQRANPTCHCMCDRRSIICTVATQVEMYADGGARGGVLEAEGMVEIKFRTPDLLAAMARTDPTVRRLKVRCCHRLLFCHHALDLAATPLLYRRP